MEQKKEEDQEGNGKGHTTTLVKTSWDTKLGTKTHFAKLTHVLPLKKAWGCCYKGLFLLPPSPPSSVDCVELKLEYITSTLHRGGRGREDASI